MATVTDPRRAAERPSLIGQSKVATEARKAKPVKWWAAVGAGVVALEGYVFIHWIVSGNATTTPTGPTPVPGWMDVVAHTWEIAGLFALAFLFYWFLYRPWRHERRFTLDGMLVLVLLTLTWQDPWLNYSQNLATYNATFHNWGNWAASLPGWMSPNGELFAEPIIWTAPVYAYACMGGVLLANLVMRKAKSRWPQLGTVGIIMVSLGFCMAFDIVVETIWMRLGIYTYAGSISWLTLFHGHYYQFPIYEVILAGAMFASFACLRYFLNDKGQTVAERGIDEVRASTRQRSGLRFLALVGLVNVLMFATYNLPMQWFGLHADDWPEDITSRSYLTDGLCGPGTDYACPGPGVPIPRPDSSHVAPDGTMHGPQ